MSASPLTSQVPAPDWAQDAVVPVGAPIGAAIADDVFDGYVVLFGGYGFASLPQSLTWVYSGHGWENLTASQTHRPPPCKYCAMTYDAEYQYVILFDQGTWVFQSGQWSQAGPANSPPLTLVEASMAYDAGDHQVVLFGGNYQDPGCNCHVTTDATWAYRASNWVNISATVGTAPSARRWATMVYDPQDSEDVLLGGWNDQTISLLNDTWTFSGGRWSLSSASGPLPRALGQLTFDATDGYVLLYGGTGCNAVNWLCSDTWTFRAGVWSQLFPLASPIVENGSQEVLSYDSTTGYTVLLEQATTSGNFTTNESIPFTWPAPLTATVSPTSTSLDANQTMALRASGSGGVPRLSYSWQNLPPGCSPTTSAFLNCTPSRGWSGQIDSIVQDASGRSSTAAVSVVVDSDPTVTAPAPNVGAADLGMSFAFSSTVSGGAGSYVFDWTTAPSLGCSSTTTGYEPCRPTRAGSYPVTVAVQDANGFTSPPAATTFDVYTGPTVTLAENRTNFDLGESVLFWANATGGTGVFTFVYGGLPTGCASRNVTPLNCSPTALGTFGVTVTVQDTGGGHATSSTVSFTVNPDPIFGSFWYSRTPVENTTDTWLTFENSSGDYQLNLSAGTPSYFYCLSTYPTTAYDRCSGWTGQASFHFGIVFTQPYGIAPGSYLFNFSAKDSTGWNDSITVRIIVVWTPTLSPMNLPAIADQGAMSSISVMVEHGAGPISFWLNDTTAGGNPLCTSQLSYGPALASCRYLVNWLGVGSLNFTARDALGIQRSGSGSLTSLKQTTLSFVSDPSSAPMNRPFTISVLVANGASPYHFCTQAPMLGGGERCLPASSGTVQSFGYLSPSRQLIMIGVSVNDSAGLNRTLWTNVTAVDDLSTSSLTGPSWGYVASNVTLNVTLLAGVPIFNLWFNDTNFSMLLCPRGTFAQDTNVACTFQPWWTGTDRLEVTVRDVFGENTTSNLSLTTYPVLTILQARVGTGGLSAPPGGVLSTEAGAPVFLNATFGGGKGSLEYGWWVSGALVSENNGTGRSWNISWIPSRSGTFLAMFELRDAARTLTSVSFTLSVGVGLSGAQVQAAPALLDVGLLTNVTATFVQGVAPFSFSWGSRSPAAIWSFWTTSVPWLHLSWTSAGTYLLTVSVRDADHALSSSSENVTVLALPALPCAPTSSSTHWTAGSELNFTIGCLMGGAPTVLLTWNWGDGLNSSVTSTGSSHTYAAAGHYNVTVEATDAFHQRALSLPLEVTVLGVPAGTIGRNTSAGGGSGPTTWVVALVAVLGLVALLGVGLALAERRRRPPPSSARTEEKDGEAGDDKVPSDPASGAEEPPSPEVPESELRRSAEIDAALIEVMRGGRRAGLPEFRESLAVFGLNDSVLLEHLFALKTSGKVLLLPESQETDSPMFVLAPSTTSSPTSEHGAAPQVDEAMLNDFLARRASSLESEPSPEGAAEAERT